MVPQCWRKMPGKYKSLLKGKQTHLTWSATLRAIIHSSLSHSIRSVVKPVSIDVWFCGMPRQRYLSLSNEISFFVFYSSPAPVLLLMKLCTQHSAVRKHLPQLEILHFNSILFCCQQQQQQQQQRAAKNAWERMLSARVVIYVLCRVPCVTIYLSIYSTFSMYTMRGMKFFFPICSANKTIEF